MKEAVDLLRAVRAFVVELFATCRESRAEEAPKPAAMRMASVAHLFCLSAALLFLTVLPAFSVEPSERLADPALESRARAISATLRCLVCQNESIDDSEADLAHDLRQVVRQQVAQGRSDAEIKRFLTDRYGEFVLMTPAFSWTNLALWGGPFAVVVLGAGLLVARLRNRLPEEDLSPVEAERVRRLSETDGA